MENFEVFTCEAFTSLVRLWRDCCVESVCILCGPLEVYASWDPVDHRMEYHTTHLGVVSYGSWRWFNDSRYTIIRCLYGIMRIEGVTSLEWELGDDYEAIDQILYEQTVEVYSPHMRFTIPTELHHCMLVENLWSRSFMTIFPIVPPVVPHPLDYLQDDELYFLAELIVDPELNMPPGRMAAVEFGYNWEDPI